MAKYLITGVAGFIGSALAHRLLEQLLKMDWRRRSSGIGVPRSAP